jgi:hypothetical protein
VFAAGAQPAPPGLVAVLAGHAGLDIGAARRARPRPGVQLVPALLVLEDPRLLAFRTLLFVAGVVVGQGLPSLATPSSPSRPG